MNARLQLGLQVSGLLRERVVVDVRRGAAVLTTVGVRTAGRGAVGAGSPGSDLRRVERLAAGAEGIVEYPLNKIVM